jgi:hypothetical protein
MEAATAGFPCSVMGVSRDYILFSNALNAWGLGSARINHENRSAIPNGRKAKVMFGIFGNNIYAYIHHIAKNGVF